jgi:hypothetical protein
VAQDGYFDEKTEGRKSRDTAPLNWPPFQSKIALKERNFVVTIIEGMSTDSKFVG